MGSSALLQLGAFGHHLAWTGGKLDTNLLKYILNINVVYKLKAVSSLRNIPNIISIFRFLN